MTGSIMDLAGSDQDALNGPDIDRIINYIRSVSIALLGATAEELDTSFGKRHSPSPQMVKVVSSFATDPNPVVLFAIKEAVETDSEEDNYNAVSYKLSTTLIDPKSTIASIGIIKQGPLTDASLNSQLQTVSLPKLDETSPFEVLHSMMHFAVAPYFDAFCKGATQSSTSGASSQDESNSGLSSTRKKISELEMSLLHLRQNIDIPDLVLTFHPVIEKCIKEAGSSTVSVDAIPEEYLSDITFLNSLQSNVNRWIKSVQGITRITRDPPMGSATQEINFWLSMEVALKKIEEQLQSPGVTLTLDVLRQAKRFHATVSFLSDTGIKEAIEKVARFNQLMRDFPINELISATTLSGVQNAIVAIFGHLNKKLRVVSYPVSRALSLVGAISDDLDRSLRALLGHKKIMNLPFSTLNEVLQETSDVFTTWDDCTKEFTNIARDVTRKRSEKFIPIRFAMHHTKLKERLEYIQSFRSRHEDLCRTLRKVLGDGPASSIMPTEFDGMRPLEEITAAYDALKEVDALATSEHGTLLWNNAERVYEERTLRVEQAIISMLRDRLATAKNSNEMFRVFSKFNALFIRPSIRGAIQEYQTRLIDNVKNDIDTLHERFRKEYANSEDHEMFKLRDIPSVSGTIIWIKQIENQLDNHIRRVEDVLGHGWQNYAEGKHLYSASISFRKKLDTRHIYENWVSSVAKKKLAIAGTLFRITKSRSAPTVYDIFVNFDAEVVTLFKEVRNLANLNFQVPHAITNVSRDAKRVYPFAVSLTDSLQSFKQTRFKIKDNTELSGLLSGSENAVYNLLAKGIDIEWESYAHVYDVDAIPGAHASDNRYVKFVRDLNASISTFVDKANNLLIVYSTIEDCLTSLEQCNFSHQEFNSSIARIQESVDSINVDGYSNVTAFVSRLNDQIKSRLIERCQQLITIWLESFADNDSGRKLSIPLHPSVHELGLKNQLITLNPPLERACVHWLSNLQQNINMISTLPRVNEHRFKVIPGRENIRAASKFSLASFSDITLELHQEITKCHEKINGTMDEVDQYLQKWYQFQSLWDLDEQKLYDTLGSDMEKWLQLMNDIRKERSTFDTSEASRSFGVIKIDFQLVQSRINSKYDIWQHNIIQKFSQLLAVQMKETCSELENTRRDLEKQRFDISSTKSLVSLVYAVQSCKSKLDTWKRNVMLYRSGQTTLSRYRFQFPSNWLFIDQLENEWAALREILDRKGRLIEDQSDVISARVVSEMDRVAERTSTLEARWHEEKPVSGSLNPQQALKTLQEFESEAYNISTLSKLLYQACEALDLEYTVQDGLQVLTEEVHDFNSVWSALSTVWSSLDDLRETPWSSIVPRKLRQTLDGYLQKTKEMPTRIRQYSAFEHAQTVLKNLLRTQNLITELKSETIRERHWKRLFDNLLPRRRVFLSSITLGDVWDLNLSANTKTVEDVIAVAQGEFNLENFLHQVRDTWSSYTLELVNYRNLCRVIKNWDDLFQKCGDHLNSLQAMQNSPYYKVFEEESRSWQDKLNRMNTLFDTWVDVQRQWVYLEGVFSNNSDIQNILPVEASRFQNINSELFVIMRKVSKSPLVLDVLNISGIQSSIDRLADLLTKVQKALGEYFEKERQKFARFYFLGDDDLLEIIGNSADITRVEKHLSKMFAGVSSLEYDSETALISAIRSKEGEEVRLSESISLAKLPRVVEWLTALESQIKTSLSELLKEALSVLQERVVEEFSQKKFLLWIQKYPGQICLLAAQVFWTFEVESVLSGESGKTLESLKERHIEFLEALAGFVLQDLSVIDRKKCESLITELIHQRDVLITLVSKGINSTDSFAWRSQLTYHYDSTKSPSERLTVRQAQATFSYGFEYLGLPDKLVATPLIDRCFLSLTQALDLRLGGSPFGPAGTGKTETVKALGHALGKYVLVFCCDESFDFQSIGRILSGICQSGTWGCFDEFNRLEERILSAVSSQIERIEVGLKSFEKSTDVEVDLIGRRVPLNSETGIFITMNPDYAGRNTLPENLTKLFRSVSMAVPDKEAIAEVVLNSQGFVNASQLASNIVPYFDSLQMEMSQQIHYDFGLRALKNVLTICGRLKRMRIGSKEDSSNLDSLSWETEIALQSLRETIAPKLLPEDHAIMLRLEEVHFPGVKYNPVSVSGIVDIARKLAEEDGFLPTYQWLEKVAQLYRFQEIHHGIMLVGASGSGKSTIYRYLLKAIEKIENVETCFSLLDAKVMSKEALYGSLDITTREWTDGHFTAIIRKISENLRGEMLKHHWIVFDGDVDPDWVENLNSVLDDNKVLTLPNGERITLPPNVRLLFEVENLKYATPATVSRCGMIWFGDSIVSPEMQFRKHLSKLREIKFDDVDADIGVLHSGSEKVNVNVAEEAYKLLLSLFSEDNGLTVDSVVKEAMKLTHVMAFEPARSIESLFGLVKSACLRLQVCINSTVDFPPTSDQRRMYLIKKLLISLTWAFAGDSNYDGRKVFSTYLTTLPCFVEHAPPGDLLDFDVTLPEGEWVAWVNKVPRIDVETHAITQTDVIIPTVDTTRHEDLIYGLLENHSPIILCGPPGCGKTMTLFGALRKSQNASVIGLNFSKATTPELLIKSIEQYCTYTKTMNGLQLSPTQIGRWLVVFCDEINLPALDNYGTQKVISLMRQMIEHQGFWNEKRGQWVTLSNIQFVGACNPPEDVGRNALNPRFLRHTTVVLVDYPEEVSLGQIYGTYYSAILKCVPSLKGYAEEITKASVDVYLQSQRHFTPEVRSHYVYSPRELTRWCRGIYEALYPLESLSIEGLVRLWAHEALRLFHDRLVDEEEKTWTHSLIRRVTEKHFSHIDIHSALKGPILYSSWLTKEYLPCDQEELKRYIHARVKTFCEEELETSLVLYDDLVDHVLRIDRVLRQPQGHLILIGVSGSGKTTLTRFVAWMNGLKTFQLRTSRSYGQQEFDTDLRGLLKRTGCNGEKVCFILDESNILETSFLERMNTLLANGEVPGLFEGDEYNTLLTACREGALQQGLHLDGEEELYRWFTNQIVRNLHVVLTMNPPEGGLSSQATASPALFNRCVLNWMGDWSEHACRQVAEGLSSNLNLDTPGWDQDDNESNPTPPTDFKSEVISCMAKVHEVAKQTDDYGYGMGSIISPTPGDFLDFLSQFSELFKEKKASLEDQQRHYNSGLDKLKETVIKVRQLRSSLAEKKEQLAEKDKRAKDMLRQMVSDQNEAERRRETSIEIQHALEIQEKEIASRKSVVLNDLARAEPAVLEAQQSVSNIKKQHLTELRSMLNPPEPVKLTLESVCSLLGHRFNTWKDIQIFIRRDDFIANIVNFDNEAQMTSALRARMEKDYLSLPSFNFETVNRASKACGPLVQWVIAQVDYSSILERVGPLRDEVVQLEEKTTQTRAQAQAISEMIEELEQSIESYKNDYADLISETQSIRHEMTSVEAKVNRSVQLIDSLSAERKRWSASVKEFKTKNNNLAGNCLLSAAFLAYSGRLNQHCRRALTNMWKLLLEEHQIPFSKEETSEYLASGKRRLEWIDSGLPSDDLSVENAIVCDRFNRYPFIIDPTNQSLEFFKQTHKSRKLTVTSFLDSAFIKHLESALRFGNPILIQDAEYLDPVISQVLNKEYRKAGGRTLISLGRQDIDFSNDFKLYLLTNDPSVQVSPHVAARTTVVNFTVTRSSLENQTLNVILQHERPDVEEKRRELLKLQGEYRVHLHELEVNLLEALSDSEGSILSNDVVIEKLEKIKVEAAEVTAKVQETETVMQSVEEVMNDYQLLSAHCGKLFSVMEELPLLNKYYQFSLDLFLRMFSDVLTHKSGEVVKSVQDRVSGLTKNLYLEAFKRLGPSLLKTDKVTFSLLLCGLYSEAIYPETLVKMLTTCGNLEVDPKKSGWLESVKEHFKGVIPLSDANEAEVARILSDPSPDFSSLNLYDGECSSTECQFYDFAIMTTVRPDLVSTMVNNLCISMFGQSLLFGEVDDIDTVVRERADNRTPIALCITPGNDPTSKIRQMIERIGANCEIIAMGSPESSRLADKALQSASQRGTWLLLQNIHLSDESLETIEKRIKSLRSHPNFRFLFTTKVGARIPTTLLRMSRIYMVESPTGIRSNMQGSYGALQTDAVAKAPTERARLYYLMSWIHSIIIERLRYVPLGWTKWYDFNDADFDSAITVIDKWMTLAAKGRTNLSPEAIPWDAIAGLVGQTVYGGKLTSEEDQKVLGALIDRSFSPKAFDSGYKLVDASDFPSVPDEGSPQGFSQWIESLPAKEPLQWLGLKSDADDVLSRWEGRQVVREMIKTYSSTLEKLA